MLRKSSAEASENIEERSQDGGHAARRVISAYGVDTDEFLLIILILLFLVHSL